MGDDAVILEGVGEPGFADSLYSTVHGAGRICGRMEARGKKNKAGEWTRPLTLYAQADGRLAAGETRPAAWWRCGRESDGLSPAA